MKLIFLIHNIFMGLIIQFPFMNENSQETKNTTEWITYFAFERNKRDEAKKNEKIEWKRLIKNDRLKFISSQTVQINK